MEQHARALVVPPVLAVRARSCQPALRALYLVTQGGLLLYTLRALFLAFLLQLCSPPFFGPPAVALLALCMSREHSHLPVCPRLYVAEMACWQISVACTLP